VFCPSSSGCLVFRIHKPAQRVAAGPPPEIHLAIDDDNEEFRMKTTILAAATFGWVLTCAAFGQAAPADASAANSAAMEQRIRELEDRVIALEGKLRTMESNAAAQPAQPQPAQPTATAETGAQASQAGVPATPSATETQAGIAAGGQQPVYGGGSAAGS